ncbi:MAG: hypothetical protein IKD18_03670 [Clostridia bacterium]|nr:hypothetical protein [Clostridia bacterium]
MKKILALFLGLVTLLSMVACSGGTAPATTEENKTEDVITEEEKKTEEKKTEEKKTEEKKEENKNATPHPVSDPLTWDRINAIPVANASMSVEQLRQICVDFFSLQVSFPWTPKTQANYEVDSQNHKVEYAVGSLHGGIPYVNLGSNNLYRVMDFYDSATGIYDVSMLEVNETLAGNACSSSAGIAWGRVINSASLSYTSGHTPKAGFLPLGPYKANLEIPTFGSSGNPDVKDILALNDTQTMYESYALLKPADGIVSGGHVRMAKEPAVVVRNEDGSINGKESYCLFVEQGCYNSSNAHTRTQEDGASYQIQGNDNAKFYFDELVKSYLPFTFAEFLGTDPVEPSTVTMSVTGENLSMKQLLSAEVSSNYIILDAYCTIRDAEGNVVTTYAYRQPKHYLKSFKLSSAAPTPIIQKYAKETGYTIEFSAQLSTGERPVFYKGALPTA